MVLRVTRKNKKNLRVECTTCKCAAGLSKGAIDDLLDEEIDAIELKLEDPSAAQPPGDESGATVDSPSGGIVGGSRIIIDRGETYQIRSRVLDKALNPKRGGAISGGETSGGKKIGGSLNLSAKSPATSFKPSGSKGGSTFGGGKGRR